MENSEDTNFYDGKTIQVISQLKQQGFNINFNLEDNRLNQHLEEFKSQDFEIMQIHHHGILGGRAIVYAIESKSGLKGTFVTGYGSCSDILLTQILKKLIKSGTV